MKVNYLGLRAEGELLMLYGLRDTNSECFTFEITHEKLTTWLTFFRSLNSPSRVKGKVYLLKKLSITLRPVC